MPPLSGLSATVALPLSTQTTTQLPSPAAFTAPSILPLPSMASTLSPSHPNAALAPATSAAAPSLPVPTAHSSTAPLPSQHSQRLAYDQLLASYQQACSERDAFAAQLEKLKEKSLALAVDTAASNTATLALLATSPTPRSRHLTAFSAATATSPAAASASATDGSSSSPAALGASNPATLQTLRDKHSLIQSTIGSIQHKTARILHDQERELIRAFRLRLTTLTGELEAERARSASGSAEWVGRCKRLSEEMDWLRGLVEELGDENKGLGKEVRRMRKAMRVQEEDREFLIRQLVQLKGENAKLRTALDRGAAGGGGNGLMLLSAGAQDAVRAIKEWGEDEEEKTAVS